MSHEGVRVQELPRQMPILLIEYSGTRLHSFCLPYVWLQNHNAARIVKKSRSRLSRSRHCTLNVHQVFQHHGVDLYGASLAPLPVACLLFRSLPSTACR